MSIFNAIVEGITSHYKDKKKNAKPDIKDYERLLNDPLLNDSAYLVYLVDHAEGEEQLDAVHEHMNSFQDRVDIYDVPSYMKVSERIIEKKGGW